MSNTKSKKKNKNRIKSSIPIIIVLTFVSVLFIFPFIWAAAISLLENGRDVYTISKYFKPPYAWNNFAIVMEEANFFRYTLNTLTIVVSVITGTLISNSFIAFGFAKYEFKGANTLFMAALCTMFLPGAVMMIPMYIIWNSLGFVNTYVPLILPSFFGAIMNIFFIRQAFKSLPSGLYEAAMIDGAHPIRIFISIYLPLAKPILATIALRTFMGSWSDLMGPLIYINSPEKNTVTLGLRYVSQKYMSYENIVMAAAVIAIIPTIIIYSFTQKTFIEGMASAAIKG